MTGLMTSGLITSVLLWTGSRFVPRRRFHRLRLGNGNRSLGLVNSGSHATALHPQPQPLSDVFVDRTRVSFLLGNAELRQHVDDFVGGNLQLPCQLVDANFNHK
jgi:hypothetical protein